MAVIVNDNEIVLTGTVGDTWWGDGFMAGEVITALAQVGRSTDIRVRLNSGGGIATDGAAIHAALAGHKGNVEIVVEGIAASAASLIAMAGNRVVMSTGAVMMIHDPALVTWGDAAAHAKSIEQLDSLGISYAEVYGEKTGKPAAEMRALMKAETWMTASEAVAGGFADAVGDGTPIEPTAFGYRTAYAHAPSALVALADARGWKPLAHPAVAPTAKASTPPPPPAAPSTEDPTMTDKTTTPAPAADDAVAAAKARIKAITTAEAATGREALAAHLAYETEMSAEAAVAALEAAPKAVAETPPTDYAARRQAAAGLAAPGAGGDQNQPKTTSLAAAVATTNKRR